MPENISASQNDINNSFTENYVSWPVPGDRNYAPVTTTTIKNFLSRIYYLHNNLQSLSTQFINHKHSFNDITGGVLEINKGGTGTNTAISNAFVRVSSDGNSYEFVDPSNMTSIISAAPSNHNHTWGDINDSNPLPINKGGTGTIIAIPNAFVRVSSDGNSYEFVDPSNINGIIDAAPENHTHTWDDITNPFLPLNRGGIGKEPNNSDVSKVVCVTSNNSNLEYTFVDVNTLITDFWSGNSGSSFTNTSQLIVSNLYYNESNPNHINSLIYIGEKDPPNIKISEIAYDVFEYNPNTSLSSLNGGDGWSGSWNLSDPSHFSLVNSNYDIPGIETDLGTVALSSNDDWAEASRELNIAVTQPEYYVTMAINLDVNWNYITFNNDQNQEIITFQKVSDQEVVLRVVSNPNSNYWQTGSLEIDGNKKLLVFKFISSSNPGQKRIQVFDLTSVPNVLTYNINNQSPIIDLIEQQNDPLSSFNLKSIKIVGRFSIDEIRIASSYLNLWSYLNNNIQWMQLRFITYSSSSLGNFQHGAIEVKKDDHIDGDHRKYNLRIVGPADKKGKINFLLYDANEYVAASLGNFTDNNINIKYNRLTIGSETPNIPGTIKMRHFDSIPDSNDLENNTLFIARDNNNQDALYIKLNGNIYKVNLTSV